MIGSTAYNNGLDDHPLMGFEVMKNFPQIKYYSYDKPIMLAGGIGTIAMANSIKHIVEPEMLIVVLGGPSMLIGLGGGAASSITSGTQARFLFGSAGKCRNATPCSGSIKYNIWV